MFDYYKVTSKNELVSQMYPPKFNKDYFAGFCKILADLARDKNNPDEFSKFIFYEAGMNLAGHIVSFRDFYEKEFPDGEVDVICEGSVWNCWDLLEGGFMDCIRGSFDYEIKGFLEAVFFSKKNKFRKFFLE